MTDAEETVGRRHIHNLSRSLQMVAIAVTVVIAGFTAQQLTESRRRAIDRAAQELSRLDMVFAEQTGRAVEVADLLVREAVDMTPERIRDNPAEVSDYFRHRTEGVRQVAALAVTDAKGTVIAASKPDLFSPLPAAAMAALAASRTEGEPNLRISEPFPNKHGRWIAMLTRRMLTRDGKFAGVAFACLDLDYFEEFYRAVELQPQGSILLHHRSGIVLARFPREDGVIGTSYANQPPFADILGHAIAGTVEMPSPIDGTMRILAIRALRAFPLAVSISVSEDGILDAWWSQVWVFGAALLCGGLGLAGVLLHLSRRARAADLATKLRTVEELARVASLDALTGLLNRTTLTERLEGMLALAAQQHSQVALLFLDLDGFKQINDVQGHKTGDTMLRVVGARLAGVAAAARADAARWGGDEFVIIAPVRNSSACGTPSSAILLAGDILRTLSQPIDLDPQTVRVVGTIGMATYPADGLTPDELVSAADKAMYDGKQSGGNVVRVYDTALANAAERSSGLERDLRQALHDGTLSLAFQPVVELPEQRCSALEALARWTHPERGVIAPSEFIPLAEQTGLIGRLGRWVLQRACHEAMTWPDLEGRPAVAVNVSLAQVLSGELMHDVTTALEQSGLPPRLLQLELTESLVGAEHERVVPVLVALRELGISIALDDFGTGFSSLSRLRNWPVNIVKIDESFVRTMSEDGAAVIRATLLVAREYGLTVTAEGVETVEQWKELAGLGVRQFQGYLFARPLAPADVEAWLAQVGRAQGHQARRLGWSKLENSPGMLAATASGN